MRSVPTGFILGALVLAACQAESLGPRESSISSSASSAPSPAIEIKFREALRVRITAGELRSAAGGRLDAVKGVFALHGSPRILPLFTIPVPDLEQLSRDARARSGRAAPDLASWYRVTGPAGADMTALLANLRALPEVEAAYPAPAPAPPPGTAPLPVANLLTLLTPDWSANQSYFGPAPGGTEAEFARTQPGGRGQGIKVIDIEYDWHFEHEDLGLSSAVLLGGQRSGVFGNEHGTAVLGLLVARDNGFGVTGGVPDAVPRVVSPIFSGSYLPANAVAIGAANMKAGDVLVLEQQVRGPNGGCNEFTQIGCVPPEWIPSVFDAIVVTTQAGKIVVEAAGNGQQNLDAPEFQNRFNRQLFNSGAIIVGAGDDQHAMLGFSDYGSRVDVQAHGQNVTTTGYGDLSGGSTTTQSDDYTAFFNGTSSATPIVAVAAAALEGNAKAAGKPLLSPEEVRSLLRRTGSPQTGDLTRLIGPSPNLRAALGAPVVHNTWATKSLAPTARSYAVGREIGGKLYLAGGLASNGTSVLSKVEVYSPHTNSWAGKAAMPAARWHGNGAGVINGLLYVAGGADTANRPTNTLFVYNPATNTWNTKARMPVQGVSGATGVIAGQLYVMSSLSNGTSTSLAFYRYNPATNTWVARATPPAGHVDPVAAVINGKFYLAGGAATSPFAVTAKLHVYDPATNTWTAKRSMATARRRASAAVVGGKLFVIGGLNGATSLARLERYDPVTDTWITKASMPTARYALVSVAIGGLFYSVAGFKTAAVAVNEAYTP
jgi:N-acetylneuraminic acid mutarotase